MAGNYWIKFYVEILDDPKMATLPDKLWRRFYELCLLAGKENKDGNIPDTESIAWSLRKTVKEIEPDLLELEKLRLISMTDKSWYIVNFSKRQEKMSDAEKQLRFRERQHKDEYYRNQSVTEPVTEPVTDALPKVTQITDNRIDKITDNRIETKKNTQPTDDILFVGRFLKASGINGLKNESQGDQIIEFRAKYGNEVLLSAATWLKEKRITNMDKALSSLRTALPEWSIPVNKLKSNTSIAERNQAVIKKILAETEVTA